MNSISVLDGGFLRLSRKRPTSRAVQCIASDATARPARSAAAPASTRSKAVAGSCCTTSTRPENGPSRVQASTSSTGGMFSVSGAGGSSDRSAGDGNGDSRAPAGAFASGFAWQARASASPLAARRRAPGGKQETPRSRVPMRSAPPGAWSKASSLTAESSRPETEATTSGARSRDDAIERRYPDRPSAASAFHREARRAALQPFEQALDRLAPVGGGGGRGGASGLGRLPGLRGNRAAGGGTLHVARIPLRVRSWACYRFP